MSDPTTAPADNTTPDDTKPERASTVVGAVIGTEDSTPMEWWCWVDPDHFLQLDDVVIVERKLPGREAPVKMYGIVQQLRARHDGAKYDEDVRLARDGIIPTKVSEAAMVAATRFEPEVFVPPLPMAEVKRAEGKERDIALFFDQMEHRLPAGLSRDNQPVFLNYEFVDGTRGAHINISGMSGVATKTSYATFLLHSLFTSGVLGGKASNTKALIFNVKGEDLMFLDFENTRLDDRPGNQRDRYAVLGLSAHAFQSVDFWAPPHKQSGSKPWTGARSTGVKAFCWTLGEFCKDGLLPYLFADAQDEKQQYTTTVSVVADLLRKVDIINDAGAVRVDGEQANTLRELVDIISDRVLDDASDRWRGRSIGMGTAQAFVRRLGAAIKDCGGIIRSDSPGALPGWTTYDGTPGDNLGTRRINQNAQVTVVDLHHLADRAQRFVVGSMLSATFADKEEKGTKDPVTFVVLDELNKYAPRDGSSPIKEVLVDIAERGRSLGIILIGAQQTATEVERRIVANSAIRIVGRLDSAEATRPEYAWLPKTQRQRATIIKPGTMLMSQPELPVPIVLEFPFPAWATRSDEADLNTAVKDKGSKRADDPFDGMGDDLVDALSPDDVGF